MSLCSIGSPEIKERAKALGADICGIAAVESFSDAPAGFHPLDIYGKTKSVFVYAKRVPQSVLHAESCIPYTAVNNTLMHEADNLGLKLSLELENIGIESVLIPSDDPTEFWDPESSHGKGVLSLRHAGELAGLGRIGKNTFLTNNKYGNMIYLGALLLSERLEPDSVAEYETCPEKCSLCLKSCPVSAIDGKTVDQKKCRPLSNFITKRGFVLQKCRRCREVCPNATGCTHLK